MGKLKNFIIAITSILLISCSEEKGETSHNVETATEASDKIFAGGIELSVSEKDSVNIRLYTDTILDETSIKAIVNDLNKHYTGIYFGTAMMHKQGEDYAAWIRDRYFDFRTGEIIHKSNYFKKRTEPVNNKKVKNEKDKSNKKVAKPRKAGRSHLDEPLAYIIHTPAKWQSDMWNVSRK